MSLRLLPKMSLEGKIQKFHAARNISVFASIVSVLFLIGCLPIRETELSAQASPGFERYSLKDAGFSMDYPKDWHLEDSREFGSVGFFPEKPLPREEIKPFVHLMIAGKYKDFSLENQALSEKEDVEDLGKIACGSPVQVEVQGVQGFLLTCSGGMLRYILDGSAARFIVNFPAEDIPKSIWKHMLESIPIP